MKRVRHYIPNVILTLLLVFLLIGGECTMLAKRIGLSQNTFRYVTVHQQLAEKGYENLYGTVPFTDGMKAQIISAFKLIVDLKHVAIILDEDDNAVCIGVCFPSIAKAMRLRSTVPGTVPLFRMNIIKRSEISLLQLL